ncbi:MAG: GNAT family N-acetyltransferase [Myxococcota bacterium]
MDGIEFRTLRDGERELLLDLLEAAFDERELFARYLDADSLVGPKDSWIALDGARLVAATQIFDKSIRLRGQVASIGGIGSVATHPDYERRGIATELLRHAIRDMERRGHALSLLFTGRISFYERLDWVQIVRPTWTLTRTDPAQPVASRPFAEPDLERVERIYEYYNLHADSSVVRDRSYWRAQLGYAGNPDEDFRVVERAGKIAAYARRIDFFGIPRIIEHGCAPDGRNELARLLCEFAPDAGALLLHRTDDSALADALRITGVSIQATEWGDNMWRVIDRPRLLALAELPSSVTDADLLHELVGGDSAVYWASDRF